MPQVVGLDVGSRSVKAALFERGFRGLELTSFLRVDLDPGDPASLGRALASILEKAGSGATVVARVPGDRVSIRFLDMPLTDPRKIESVIGFEVESLIPFELDEVILDHGIVRKDAQGSRVMVGAAKKDDVKAVLDTLGAAGLEPRLLAAGPATLGALALAVPSLSKGTVALVDAGFSRTEVCVLRDGKIAFARTISTGIADITDAAGGAASFDASSADVGDSGAKNAAVVVAASFVAKEVRRTLLASELPSGGSLTADRVVLFGGLSRVRGFAALLERTVGVVVEPLPLSEAEWAKSLLPRDEEAVAASAIALAFRAVGDSSVGLNLRKGDFSFRRDNRELSGLLARVVAASVILAVLSVVHYAVKDWLLVAERGHLDSEIAAEVSGAFPEVPRDRLRDGDTAVSIMRGNVDEASQRLAQLGGGPISALDVLRSVSEAVPPGMYIDVKELDLSDGKVRMRCVIDSAEAADKLQEALRKVKLFSGVDERDTTKDAGSGKWRVTYVFDVVAPGGDA